MKPCRLKLLGRFLIWIVGATVPFCGSCSTVKPWERAQLARPVMNPERDSLGIIISEHMYFSREASRGGRGVGGGGCGCN